MAARRSKIAGVSTHYDVVIVGGGAAGLATAIFAARAGRGRRIGVLDGATKLGAKILISGGGRCNVTNVRVRPEDYQGGSRNTIRRVLSAFPGPSTVEFFREIGVALHEEQWGKLFPDTHSARTVLSGLIREAERLGIELRPGHRVTAIAPEDERFRVRANRRHAGGLQTALSTTPDETCEFETSMVVLATGGQSFPKTGSDGFGFELARRLGHTIVSPAPALAPLVLEGDFHAILSGIAQEVELTITARGDKPVRIGGPMLWTHFGVSGPAALDASRYWHRASMAGRSPAVRVNFLPGLDFAGVEQRIMAAISRQPRALARNVLSALTSSNFADDSVKEESDGSGPTPKLKRADAGSGWSWEAGERKGISKRLVEVLIDWTGVAGDIAAGRLTREQRRKIVHALTEWPMPVAGSRGFNFAEATAGGVSLSEIDPGTMESRACPGLFLVGEVLDVDGRIGGFNFQWAWSSGFVAGNGIARALGDERGGDNTGRAPEGHVPH